MGGRKKVLVDLEGLGGLLEFFDGIIPGLLFCEDSNGISFGG